MMKMYVLFSLFSILFLIRFVFGSCFGDRDSSLCEEFLFFLFYVSFVFEIRLGDRGSMPEEIVIKDIVKMVSLMIINTVFAGL